MNIRKLAPPLLPLLAVPLIACGSHDRSSESASAGNQPVFTSSPSLESAPTSPIGGTLKVWDNSSIGSSGDALSEYTISNPRKGEGDRYYVDLLIDTKQGNQVPGTFWVLTSSGQKIEQYDAYTPQDGQIDLSGSMVTGEKRRGFISFQIPTGDQVSKIILYHGTVNAPAAFWTA